LLSVGLVTNYAGASSNVYYLHAPNCTQDASTPPAILSLSFEGDAQEASCQIEILSTAYVWTTAPVEVATSYSSGAWDTVLWLNTTGTLTEYNISLGIMDQFGNSTLIASAVSPVIDSFVPASYTVELPASNLTLGAGSSLALSILNQDGQGNSTDPGFIFLDSTSTPSRLLPPGSNVASESSTVTYGESQSSSSIQSATNPAVTYTATTTVEVMTTATQSPQIVTTPSPAVVLNQVTTTALQPNMNLGFVLLICGIGVGISLIVGTIILLKASKRSGKSEIVAYQGTYYCRTHRVQLGLVRGKYWCPVDQKYLNA